MKSPCGPSGTGLSISAPSIIRQFRNDASQYGEQNVLPPLCRRMRPKADWLQKSQVFLMRGWRFDCHIGDGSSVVEAYCGVERL